MTKSIISCAVTGAVHTPSMSPHLPCTPDEIARQSIDAANAGAAIIHLHARNPADGRPSASCPETFRQCWHMGRIGHVSDRRVSTGSGCSRPSASGPRIRGSSPYGDPRPHLTAPTPQGPIQGSRTPKLCADMQGSACTRPRAVLPTSPKRWSNCAPHHPPGSGQRMHCNAAGQAIHRC